MKFRALSALLVVVVAGCSSGRDPGGGASASSVRATVAPSPSRTGPLTTGAGVLPGEKPPVLDYRGTRHTAGGAEIFAAYFIKALSWSLATTDPYLLRTVSAPSCSACSRYLKSLNDLSLRGGHVVGGRLSFSAFGRVTGVFKFKSDFVFQARITQEPSTIVLPSAPPSKVMTAPTTDVSRIYVSWLDGAWSVVEEGGE